MVQWDRTGGANQTWRPVSIGGGVYKIESCHAHGQYLSVKNNDYDNGGKIEINSQGPSIQWRIEGHAP